MFERRLYFHIDWLLLGAVLLLAALGLSMIYSTTYVTLPDGTGHAGARFWVQLYAVGLGVLALMIFLAIDYRFLAEHSLFLYGGLIAAPSLRAGRRGQGRRIDSGGFRSASSTCSHRNSGASRSH